MIRGQGDLKIVCTLEQQTELFKAQTPNPVELRRDVEQEQNVEKRGSLNHFFSWLSLEVFDHWQMNWMSLDCFQGTSRNIMKAIFVSLKHRCWNNLTHGDLSTTLQWSKCLSNGINFNLVCYLSRTIASL